MNTHSGFESLYRTHAPAVTAYARRRTTRGDADDVVAEVFLVAWRRRDDIPDPPLPWLLGVARRVLANRRRGEGRAAALRHRLAADPAPLSPPPSAQDPESRTWEALRSLGEGDRELLTLTAWEGMEISEIAVVLGLRPNTVSVRLHRARRRFAAALAAQDHPAVPELEPQR